MPKFDSLRIFALWMTVALLPALQHVCYADASSASLTVSIADSSGAVVPNAKIVLRNMETSQEQHAITDKIGGVAFPFLKPGHYSLTVSKTNFSDIAVDNILLNVGDEKQLNLALKVGQTTQNITVDGSGLTINTTDGSVSTVIDHRFVENIPLNGRSFQDLILLTPGVVTQSPQATSQGTGGLGTSGDFSVNGQRTESNIYTVDGVSANSNPGTGGTTGASSGGNVPSATALGTTQSLISVDALEEFRITSSTYSAEYGRTPGGQISFVTRSGSNDFHGTVFDYLRNDFFDANNWFSNYYNTRPPALRQNDFGGTLGGPINIPHLYNGRDRTFLFFSYEGLRLTQPQPAQLQYVPSTSLRQNAPSAIQPILNAFPLPTVGGIDYGSGLAQFIQSDSLPGTIDSTSVRIDHALSSRFRLFFRFAISPSGTAARQLSLYQPSNSSTQTDTFGATAQISKKVVDDLRLGFVHSAQSSESIVDTFGGARPTNIPEALGSDTSKNASGVVELVLGGNASILEPLNSSNDMRQWNVTDTLSWLHGRHSIKAGIDYRNIATSGQPYNPFAVYVYTDESQVLANAALEGIGEVFKSAAPRYRELSAFAQDEWRLAPTLTLSLGLRWEINPSPGAKDGNLPYTLNGNIDDPSTLSIAPQGTPLYRTTWYNLAPRAGVAWIANRAAEYQTVIRAGGGVFFDTGNQTASFGYSGIGYSAQKMIYGAAAPFPGGINSTSIPISLAPPFTNSTAYYLYPHLQLPYTLEWSTAVEQALGKAQTLTLTYIGSNGRRLLEDRQFSVNSLNPDFGTIVAYSNGLTSNYQALQAKFRHSVSRGLQALASYTWSHSLDYGSNSSTITPVRGDSDFDVRNSFTMGASWTIPAVRHGRAAQALLAAWALDAHVIARTAFPVTLQGNMFTEPGTGNVVYSGVDLVPNQPLYLHIEGIPGNREINEAAFGLPATGLSGDAPRNPARGFGASQVNLAVMREFHLEKVDLQFRAESFNILNHPSFGYVDPTLGSSTFGQATQSLNQSLTTVSPLYQMGGPRSMQFALKLLF